MNLEQTHSGGDYVVFLPCTDKKVQQRGYAINVYHTVGPIATVKSVLKADEWNENVDAYFLSSKYRVTRLDEEIDRYNDSLSEDDIGDFAREVADFLRESDYEIGFSLLGDRYQQVIDEVAFGRVVEEDVQTHLLQICTRTPMIGGRDTLRQIVSGDLGPTAGSATDVTW